MIMIIVTNIQGQTTWRQWKGPQMDQKLGYRKQRLVINGTASDWTSITCGVPQGSVLGSVLFIIYKKDIDVRLNNFISKLADDTKTGNSIVDDCDRLNLQEDLRKISQRSER